MRTDQTIASLIECGRLRIDIDSGKELKDNCDQDAQRTGSGEAR